MDPFQNVIILNPSVGNENVDIFLPFKRVKTKNWMFEGNSDSKYQTNLTQNVVIYSNIFSFSISILIYDYVLLHASEQGALDYTAVEKRNSVKPMVTVWGTSTCNAI